MAQENRADKNCLTEEAIYIIDTILKDLTPKVYSLYANNNKFIANRRN
jgi:hypothetical protein